MNTKTLLTAVIASIIAKAIYDIAIQPLINKER
jgi:hypothetical protein